MTALARIYRWEIAKLLAQKRTYLGLGAAIVVPIIFVLVLGLLITILDFVLQGILIKMIPSLFAGR